MTLKLRTSQRLCRRKGRRKKRMTLKLRSGCAGAEGGGTKEMTRKLRSGCGGASGRKQEMTLKLRSGCCGAGGAENTDHIQISQQL